MEGKERGRRGRGKPAETGGAVGWARDGGVGDEG